MRSSAYASEQEVGAVKNVEAVGIELHFDPLRDQEGLGQRHIGCPEARPDERVATQVSYARQTRRREGNVGRGIGVGGAILCPSPAIRPRVMRNAADTLEA
jgi:hypothetical protein